MTMIMKNMPDTLMRLLISISQEAISGRPLFNRFISMIHAYCAINHDLDLVRFLSGQIATTVHSNGFDQSAAHSRRSTVIVFGDIAEYISLDDISELIVIGDVCSHGSISLTGNPQVAIAGNFEGSLIVTGGLTLHVGKNCMGTIWMGASTTDVFANGDFHATVNASTADVLFRLHVCGFCPLAIVESIAALRLLGVMIYVNSCNSESGFCFTDHLHAKSRTVIANSVGTSPLMANASNPP